MGVGELYLALNQQRFERFLGGVLRVKSQNFRRIRWSSVSWATARSDRARPSQPATNSAMAFFRSAGIEDLSLAQRRAHHRAYQVAVALHVSLADHHHVYR